MMWILVDRDATLELSRGYKQTYEKPEIVATFVTPVTLYRIVDERELRDIFRTGRVTGGSFSTEGERKHGASWGVDRDAIVKWGLAWQKRRLGPKLYLLELPNAGGRRFYHLGPMLTPTFEPFGKPEQLVEMPDDQCSTGLGCSVVNVRADELYVYRVKPDGGTVPLERKDAQARATRKPLKTIDLHAVTPDLYYTGWIYGRSVIVYRDQTRRDDRGYYARTWDVIVRRPDGHEEKLVIAKKSRKAAIDEAAEILELESLGD